MCKTTCLSSLQSRSLRSNKGIALLVLRVKTNIGARAFHSFTPSLWNILPLSFPSATLTVIFRKRLKTHLFDLASPPPPIIDTSTPCGPLMLSNWFIDFAVEHWFGCLTTEPGYAMGAGAIEMWLIDWLIIPTYICTRHIVSPVSTTWFGLVL